MSEYDKLPIESTVLEASSFKPNSTKKHRKHRRMLSTKIPRKSLSIVDNKLKGEYKKYLKKIDNKKQCKKMTFKQFVEKKIGKKSKRNSRKSRNTVKSLSNKETSILTPIFGTTQEPEPSVQPETTVLNTSEPELSVQPEQESSVQPEPTVLNTPEQELSVQPEPELNVNTEDVISTPNKPEEQKSIINTVTDALGISKKEGGRKKRKSSSRRK